MIAALARQMMSAARQTIHGSLASRSPARAFRASVWSSRIRRFWKEQSSELKPSAKTRASSSSSAPVTPGELMRPAASSHDRPADRW
jgi:hypothetical protein